TAAPASIGKRVDIHILAGRAVDAAVLLDLNGALGMLECAVLDRIVGSFLIGGRNAGVRGSVAADGVGAGGLGKNATEEDVARLNRIDRHVLAGRTVDAAVLLHLQSAGQVLEGERLDLVRGVDRNASRRIARGAGRRG